MAKEELVAGLNNAISRGESIERAVQTLISAGYNAEEVREAANMVNMGVLGKMPESQTLSPTQITSKSSEQALSQESQNPKKHRKLIIIISVLVLIFLLGFISLMFFSDAILNLFFSK